MLDSWATHFVSATVVAAFGQTREVLWHFYLVTSGWIALFIVLPCVAGSWLSIHRARFLDRRSFQITAVCSAFLLLAVAAFWWKGEPANGELLETRVLDLLDQLLIKTRFAQFPFLPSYWLSSSVIQW